MSPKTAENNRLPLVSSLNYLLANFMLFAGPEIMISLSPQTLKMARDSVTFWKAFWS